MIRSTTLDRRLTVVFIFALLLSVLGDRPSIAQTDDRLIELEVYGTRTTPAVLQHQWLEALSEVQADRVSAKTARKPSPSVEESSFGGSTVILVKGVINNRKIKLPGKSF
ncbi:hypothetical protein OAG71_05035, partial [bacterium]|nr:hypothetical protein [bacterium]